jgi:hypothetical protein
MLRRLAIRFACLTVAVAPVAVVGDGCTQLFMRLSDIYLQSIGEIPYYGVL